MVDGQELPVSGRPVHDPIFSKNDPTTLLCFIGGCLAPGVIAREGASDSSSQPLPSYLEPTHPGCVGTL